jgi:hypothetical protein
VEDLLRCVRVCACVYLGIIILSGGFCFICPSCVH